MADTTAVSKKGTIGVSGLAVIANSPDFKTQLILAAVLIAYMAIQGFLDWKKA